MYWLSVSLEGEDGLRSGSHSRLFFRVELLLVLLTSGALSDPVLIVTNFMFGFAGMQSAKLLTCTALATLHVHVGELPCEFYVEPGTNEGCWMF